jgi:hypothetical protein
MAFKHLKVKSDLLPPIWKFKAVGQKIYDDLHKPVFVPVNLSVRQVIFFVGDRYHQQLNVLLHRDMSNHVKSLTDHLKNVEEFLIQLESTLLYLAQVQEVHH